MANKFIQNFPSLSTLYLFYEPILRNPNIWTTTQWSRIWLFSLMWFCSNLSFEVPTQSSWNIMKSQWLPVVSIFFFFSTYLQIKRGWRKITFRKPRLLLQLNQSFNFSHGLLRYRQKQHILHIKYYKLNWSNNSTI